MENIKQINNNTPQKLVYGGYGHSPSGKQYVYKGDKSLRVGQSVVAPVTNHGKTYNTMFTIQRAVMLSGNIAKNEQERLQNSGINIKTIPSGLSLLTLPTGQKYEQERLKKQPKPESERHAITRWKKDSEQRRAIENELRLGVNRNVFLEKKTRMQNLLDQQIYTYSKTHKRSNPKKIKLNTQQHLELVYLGKILTQGKKDIYKSPSTLQEAQKKKKKRIKAISIKIKVKKPKITKFMLEWEKRMPEIYKRLEKTTRVEKRIGWTIQAKNEKTTGGR